MYGNELFATDIDFSAAVTYAEMEEKIEEYVRIFAEAGVEEGQAVGLMMGNCLEFMISFYAISFLNAVSVPINPEIEKKKLKYIIDDAELRYIVKKEADIHGLSGIDFQEHRINEETLLAELLWDSCQDKKAEYIEDTALILYTSGTTGEPKGVQLTHKNLISEMSYIMTAHELARDDKVLCVLPWYHINGLVITMLTPFCDRGHFSNTLLKSIYAEYCNI